MPSTGKATAPLPQTPRDDLVASDAASASRSRHFLRRYHVLQQRLQQGEAQLLKVPDAAMPADFLTKWIGKDKLKQSVAYATNASNHVK